MSKQPDTRRARFRPHLSGHRVVRDRYWLAAGALLSLGVLLFLGQWGWPALTLFVSPLSNKHIDSAGRERGGRDVTPGTPAASASQSIGGPIGGAVVIQQSERQIAKLSRGLSPHLGGGVTIEEAPAGSVAQDLGLEARDIIVSINGTRIDSPSDFARIYLQQGRPRQLEIIHEGRSIHRHP